MKKISNEKKIKTFEPTVLDNKMHGVYDNKYCLWWR